MSVGPIAARPPSPTLFAAAVKPHDGLALSAASPDPATSERRLNFWSRTYCRPHNPVSRTRNIHESRKSGAVDAWSASRLTLRATPTDSPFARESIGNVARPPQNVGTSHSARSHLRSQAPRLGLSPSTRSSVLHRATAEKAKCARPHWRLRIVMEFPRLGSSLGGERPGDRSSGQGVKSVRRSWRQPKRGRAGDQVRLYRAHAPASSR